MGELGRLIKKAQRHIGVLLDKVAAGEIGQEDLLGAQTKLEEVEEQLD